jgi:uncharacterized protein (TIRG00374 family)
VVILGGLIYYLGPSNLILAFEKANYLYWIPAILIFLITLEMGALNLYFLISRLNPQIKHKEIRKMFLVSALLGLITPGKVGEFAIVKYLKRYNITYGQSINIPIIDKLITIVVLGIFAAIGFFKYFELKAALIITIMILIIVILIIFLMMNSRSRKFIRRYILQKHEDKFKGFYATLRYFLVEQKKYLTLNLINTLLRNILTSIVILILFRSFGASPSLFSVILIFSATTIISNIPISISGIGIKEGAAAAMFSLVKIEPIITVSTYLIFTAITYLCLTPIAILSYLSLTKKE